MDRLKEEVRMFQPDDFRRQTVDFHYRMRGMFQSLYIAIIWYTDGFVICSINQWGCSGCVYKTHFIQTINIDDEFNPLVFRNKLTEIYQSISGETIDDDVLMRIVLKLIDYVTAARSKHTATATIWIGQQLRREWLDLLPLVTQNILKDINM